MFEAGSVTVEDEQRDAAADDAEPRPVLAHHPAEAPAGPRAPPPLLAAPHHRELHIASSRGGGLGSPCPETSCGWLA